MNKNIFYFNSDMSKILLRKRFKKFCNTRKEFYKFLALCHCPNEYNYIVYYVLKFIHILRKLLWHALI